MSDAVSFQSRLGYQFKNQVLLTQALTHRSRGGDNNERLEYLGDSILGFVIAEALFMQFPEALEGDLTRMRSQLVRKETLAAQARYLDMQRDLLLGSGELKSGGYDRDSILADTFEAVIGAIYLDSDLPTVKNTLLELFEQQLKQISPLHLKDHKTRLQEHLQQHDLTLPIYQVIEQSGKPHALTFTVSCTVSILPDPVTAIGSSRRSAEQSSAKKVLSILNTND